MKAVFIGSIFIVLIVLVGCSGDASNFAPDDVGGTSYNIIIRAGTGNLASSGTATLIFAKDGSFIFDGDDVNVVDDKGTYTYKRLSNNTAEATFIAETFGKLIYKATFTDSSSGTFVLIFEVNGFQQSGDFLLHHLPDLQDKRLGKKIVSSEFRNVYFLSLRESEFRT